MTRIILLLIAVAGIAVSTTQRQCHAATDSNAERPNIVLIMSDDMGFSDIGCYGGEIQKNSRWNGNHLQGAHTCYLGHGAVSIYSSGKILLLNYLRP